MKYSTYIFFLFIFVSTSLFATPTEWKLIKDKSNLTFTATQNNAPVSGEFKLFDSDIFFDLNDLTNNRIHVIVHMKSLDTSYTEITSTLRTADWFYVKKFPKAEFSATQFQKLSENKYQATGMLTIRDKTAPVVLTFSVKQISPTMVEAFGGTTFKRSTFGVGRSEWSSTKEIKDEVVVNFKAIAVKQ